MSISHRLFNLAFSISKHFQALPQYLHNQTALVIHKWGNVRVINIFVAIKFTAGIDYRLN